MYTYDVVENGSDQSLVIYKAENWTRWSTFIDCGGDTSKAHEIADAMNLAEAARA